MQLSYLTDKEKRIEAKFEKTPKTFFVEEIMKDGQVLSIGQPFSLPDNGKEYLYVVVEKRNWATIELVKEMAKRLRISAKRFSFAGNKDKKATTIQLLSIRYGNKEIVERLRIRDVDIRGCWYGDKPIMLGDLLGNKFRVIFDRDDDRIDEIYSNLNGVFPNYFGEQRFGSVRKNTHLIGEAIVRNEMRRAVEIYLMDGDDEYRKRLAEERDFKKALSYFPKYMRFERLLLSHLAKHPMDYTNALRKLPRQLLLMFVHAFQSYLFNIVLSERVREKAFEPEEGEFYCGSKCAFPDLKKKGNKQDGFLVGLVIGYKIEPSERELDLLERFYIKPQDFKIKSLPEASSPGAHRLLLSPVIGFSHKDNLISFSLPSGAYATAFLREFLKEE